MRILLLPGPPEKRKSSKIRRVKQCSPMLRGWQRHGADSADGPEQQHRGLFWVRFKELWWSIPVTRLLPGLSPWQSTTIITDSSAGTMRGNWDQHSAKPDLLTGSSRKAAKPQPYSKVPLHMGLQYKKNLKWPDTPTSPCQPASYRQTKGSSEDSHNRQDFTSPGVIVCLQVWKGEEQKYSIKWVFKVLLSE